MWISLMTLRKQLIIKIKYNFVPSFDHKPNLKIPAAVGMNILKKEKKHKFQILAINYET